MKIVKSTLAFLLVAVLSGVAVLSCSDGKLNLLLVFRTERDEEDLPEFPPHYLLSSAVAKASSSSAAPSSSSEEPLSSSSEEPPPLSSSEEPSSSSSIPEPSSSSSAPVPSSSSRGPRSSSSKEFVDYPPLEPGGDGVAPAAPGGVTRYWDGCKPSCSRVEHLVQADGRPSPNGVARNCDINGKEIPNYFRMSPIQPTWAEFIATPNACVPESMNDWGQSSNYKDWAAANPGLPISKSLAYICSADQIPYAVNDTLAYAFAANSKGNCGKCFMLQFRSDWNYGAARPTHKALAGKILIVMINNFGVGGNAFDLMIPGGGVGDYDAVSEQLGVTQANLGRQTGGLLAECTFGGVMPGEEADFSQINVGFAQIEREPLERVQECLRAKCNRAFKNHPVHLKGCMWSVDWFMAADNPEAYYKEVDCPKYLLDRYGSTIPLPKRPEDLNDGVSCNIGGTLKCEP